MKNAAKLTIALAVIIIPGSIIVAEVIKWWWMR